ncbi:type III PLP-dependent enzyme [Jidongwangia harbinensis]|uniref:type III PLP-dependent enzyme n=1 Tax=Jidongwangia harbinensis TaxID=2878561 RepID=UPI001CDA07AA|nr:type III PLP-dependent enzyme [Jidongwangia harbinensis]MCA2211343.1 type III PLP-dependent enzyme [Jidongwangia harbinensis]
MTAEFAIQGLPVGRLAGTFGTPLYLYDGEILRRRWAGLRAGLPPAMEVFYSLKANPNLSICALLRGLGARAEVSSLAELVTAQRAGVPAGHIVFLGPGKTVDEVDACLRAGVAAIVCESFGELDLIDERARAHGTVAPVMLRVNPGFAVKGSALTMGGRPGQFGIDEAHLLATGPGRLRRPGVRLTGIHTYVGTRILNEQVVAENTARILELADRLSRHGGFPLEMVDVGGGLGIAYFDGERDLDLDLLTGLLTPIVGDFAARHPRTRILLEVGRYLAGPAGVYVTRVNYTKTSHGENFAIVDGGTNHHMAAVGVGTLVKRNYPLALLNRMDEPRTERWHVTGPLCTPNDTLGKAVGLPPVRVGDLVGVLRSGAYGPSASPVLFLSHGHPAEVLVDRGRAYLIRRRDTVDDLLRAQHLSDDLMAGTPHPMTEGAAR